MWITPVVPAVDVSGASGYMGPVWRFGRGGRDWMYTALSEDQFQKAIRMTDRSDFSGSMELLNSLDSLFPSSARLAHTRARNFQGLGQKDQAIDQCTAALQRIAAVRERSQLVTDLMDAAQIDALDELFKNDDTEIPSSFLEIPASKYAPDPQKCQGGPPEPTKSAKKAPKIIPKYSQNVPKAS